MYNIKTMLCICTYFKPHFIKLLADYYTVSLMCRVIFTVCNSDSGKTLSFINPAVKNKSYLVTCPRSSPVASPACVSTLTLNIGRHYIFSGFLCKMEKCCAKVERAVPRTGRLMGNFVAKVCSLLLTVSLLPLCPMALQTQSLAVLSLSSTA